ncbi:rna-directed dna polymerase from mobile element jockey-like [Pitangus sulphuratus]|nr:rna-directed dna polymerase from mobile element jockey-like [Pitangus sulphuratus]
MRNKQEELEALAQSQGFDITGISETWWDETCNWSALLDGYQFFRRDRQGRRGRGVALYVMERPPSQDDDVDKLFFEELRDTSKSTALVLMGDFNLPEINWEHHTAGTTWSRRFLKNLDDNCLEQVLREVTRKDALLDLLLVNRKDLVNKVEIGGRLGHSDHEAIKFKISVDRKKSAIKPSTLDMRRADFRLLRELVTDGLDGIHPRILKELADVIAKPFLMIFEWSWESREVPGDWKLENVLSVFKKDKKENPENYRPVSLTSVPDKVMGKIILGSIGKHLKDNAVIGYSQHSFMRGKSCLSNLISFYDKVTHLADQGKPGDVIFLDFSKAFDTVSHRILLDKMSSTQLDKHIIVVSE